MPGCESGRGERRLFKEYEKKSGIEIN